MTSPKWPIGFLFAGFLISLLFAVDKASWISYSDMAPIFIVLNPFGNGPLVWLNALKHVILFDYACFSGSWIIARMGILTVIGGGFIASIVLNIVGAIGGSAGGLFRAGGR